jgi:hypothetical protein
MQHVCCLQLHAACVLPAPSHPVWGMWLDLFSNPSCSIRNVILEAKKSVLIVSNVARREKLLYGTV